MSMFPNELQELEQSNRYLIDELADTKRALIGKELQCEEQLSTIARLESQLRSEAKARVQNHSDLQKALRVILDHVTPNDGYLEMWWSCTFAFLAVAIGHKENVRTFKEALLDQVNQLDEERKLRAELAAKQSNQNDTVDSLSFELQQVKRERDEVLNRSQRQAARITDLEGSYEQCMKANREYADNWNRKEPLLEKYKKQLNDIEKILR